MDILVQIRLYPREIYLSLADIPKLLSVIYDNLNPGGHVEIMETLMLMKAIDDSLNGHPLQTWNNMMVEGIRMPSHGPFPAAALLKISQVSGK